MCPCHFPTLLRICGKRKIINKPLRLIEIMVPINFLTLKTHFDLGYTQRLINDSAFENTIWVMGTVWFSVCNYVLSVLGLLFRFIFRYVFVFILVCWIVYFHAFDH